MDTYVVPVIFPDLDTAKDDAGALVAALRQAGLHAELADEAALASQDDAGRPDPGPTTVELLVHGHSGDEVGREVQAVMDGRFPPGTLLLGEPTPTQPLG